MKDLSGKAALLTGASRGIGVYIARSLAGQGMNLGLAARSAEGLEKVRAEVEALGVRAIAVPTDVGDLASLEGLVQKVEADLGGISVLVNNAGIEEGQPYADLSQEALSQVIAVNLTGPMWLSRLVLPGMIERGEGHIVNVASVAGLVGTPYNEPYSASKHGLLGFSRSLRLTAQGEGYPVGVSVVSPGFVSEAGMYEDSKTETGVEAPAFLGSVSADEVAREVLRAIVENQAEVVVNARPIMPLVAVANFFPRFADWFARKSGVVDFFKASVQQRNR